MLREQIQNVINPRRSAESKDVVTGVLPLAQLDLPPEVIEPVGGDVQFSLTFAKDPEDYIVIKGWVESELALQCQRCLQPYRVPIRSEFCLSPVRTTTEASTLPECYDAVLMEDESLLLKQIIEEELVLSLPIVPLHKGECYV